MTQPAGFQVTHEVSAELVAGLLCCAFEGGSNYWYFIEDRIFPEGFSSEDYGEKGKAQVFSSYWHWAQLIPLQEGGALIISSKEGDEINGAKKWRLDRTSIEAGLEAMRTKHPRHYGDFLAENEDAITGDVFLQLALFGQLVYG